MGCAYFLKYNGHITNMERNWNVVNVKETTSRRRIEKTLNKIPGGHPTVFYKLKNLTPHRKLLMEANIQKVKTSVETNDSLSYNRFFVAITFQKLNKERKGYETQLIVKICILSMKISIFIMWQDLQIKRYFL